MSTTTAHLTPTLVRQVVSAAVAAPSVHNTQPWLFRFEGNMVHVLADTTRHLKAQDPDGRALYMSCGAALLNLRVAIEHFGYACHVHVQPDPMDPTRVATVEVGEEQTPTAMIDELHTAIPLRHTNRMPYDDRPVPPAVVGALAEAAAQEGADLYALQDPAERHRLVGLIHDADVSQTPATVAESHHWTAVEDSRSDGVPVSALGPIPESPATPHRDLAGGRRIPGRGFAVFEQDPTLAVLTTPNDDVRAWINAGQALERVLLVATVEGLVSTFANQPLEAPQLRWLVREPDRPIGFPQMILRLGYAPAAPATPRRPIEDVIVNE